MNLLVVIGFILPSALVYKKIHTLKAPSSVWCSASCSPSSWPCLATSWSPRHARRAARCRLAMIVPILIPFNLLKGLLNAILTLIVYKAISNLITPKKDQVKGR